ncbi:unnamed protein product, partial [Rotaria sp. Silwood2]
EPTLEYELLRRKIETQARELYYFTNHQLNKISKKLSNEDQLTWEHIIKQFGDQSRVLQASIRNITKVDGYQPWREREQENLSKLIQERLTFLQNPSKPCRDVKRFVCELNKNCGFGCEIHHVTCCNWTYNPGGFGEIFQYPSHNCTESMGADMSYWGSRLEDYVIQIPLIDILKPRPKLLPMAIPEDISDRLIRLHGNPFVWFTGQLLKYLLRPQPWLAEFMKKKYEAIKFKTPFVGIHIRRTDKLDVEAKYHDLSEYMKHVEDFYIIYQYQNPDLKFTKRVYLATDDPSVFNDTRTKYPDYVFYGDTAVAESAQMNSRFRAGSLKGVLLDLHFLSLCDYLVCTFSSQFCRVAYEAMQQYVVDGSWRIQSIDDIYYFGGQSSHYQRAVISHKNIWPGELSFERGDIIKTEGNHWDGFSQGSHTKNGTSGLYPSYKTEDIINIVKMYTYPEVKIEDADV